MDEYLQVAVLALIQGAAELLPVSSSAHVILAEKLMGLDPSSPKMTFLLVMLHTGTMVAVIVYFWPRWRELLFPGPAAEGGEGGLGAPSRFQFVKMVVLATACTGVLGLGLKYLIEDVILVRGMGHEKGEVEHLFKNLPLIGTALLAVGVLIVLAGLFEGKAERPTVGPWSAVLIGLVQGLCLPFRGFSRSGATISTALFCGVSRRLSEDFSFALAVVLTPPVLLYQLRRVLKQGAWESWADLANLLGPGLVGMVLSCLSGLLALRVLSAALEHGRWKYFGYYCIGASLVTYTAAGAGL
jgi:undecaprenyl-diphosphatase